MANWKPMTVRDIITEIKDRKVVLPVIQRRLEWPAEKMEMLFDSLFKQNPFGSIICIEEEKGFPPLFAHRPFTLDGTYTSSIQTDVVNDSNLLLVIDGQQRLQSFYIGLCGTYNGMMLYYDLFSDYENYEHDFCFTDPDKPLPSKNTDRRGIAACFWYPASTLFNRLRERANPNLVAKDIIAAKGITDQEEQEYIRENVKAFYERIFADESIGISKMNARMSDDISEDRQRVTELFRRLNFEGMKLSTLDLVASLLKSFDYRMEHFIDEVCRENSSIGIDQDVLIRLLLILNDRPGISIMNLESGDAKFATDNMERIKNTMAALKVFLKASGNENWFDTGQSAIKRSAIPLYFLAYHIFHSGYGDDELLHMFDRFDVSDKNFRSMSMWLKMSILNKVFRTGCGWKPDTTGIKKLHEVMCRNKGHDFPAEELFALYRERLHKFINERDITTSNLDDLDQEYVFYLMYNGTTRSSIRFEDKDHIHPRSLLEKKGVNSVKINNIGNLQLIDSASNRGRKNDKPLSEWLEEVDGKAAYIERHLIPDEPRLWDVKEFYEFLRERQKKIIAKIKSSF